MKLTTCAVIASALLLAGCNQPSTEEAGGGGGRPVAEPKTPVSSVQQTRDNLGDAYVLAARTHASVVRGDFQGAGQAIRGVRAELADAKRTAQLDTQARINEMDQAAIQVERQINQRALDTHQATSKFVDQVETLFASAVPPSQPTGGGGGAMQPGVTPEGGVALPERQTPAGEPDNWQPLPPDSTQRTAPAPAPVAP